MIWSSYLKFFILFGILFLNVSCFDGGFFLKSSGVNVVMYERIPVVHHRAQNENEVICRRGIPDNHILPWDAVARRAEDEEVNEGEEDIDDRITESPPGDYWFKVVPLIQNTTSHYLVIQDINFRVILSEGNETSPSFSGGYCETDPLYFFEPQGSPSSPNRNSYTVIEDIDRRFTKGNLIFYLNGPSPNEESQNQGNESFPTIRVPTYRVRWQMIGYFANRDGDRRGNFQKRGSFRTRPSTF